MNIEPAFVKVETTLPVKPLPKVPAEWWAIRVLCNITGEWRLWAYDSLHFAKTMHAEHCNQNRIVHPVIFSITLPESHDGN
jgi:hypothetical protein